MKLSEFTHAMHAQFGSTADVLTRELVVPSLGNRTAEIAIRDGIDPRLVWDSMCEALDVPDHQRVPKRLPEPPQ